MIRERYFKELAIVLQKEGFTPLPEQEQRLPVAWKGRRLSFILSPHKITLRRIVMQFSAVLQNSFDDFIFQEGMTFDFVDVFLLKEPSVFLL